MRPFYCTVHVGTLVVALKNGEYFYSNGREAMHLAKTRDGVDMSITQRDPPGTGFAKTFRLKGSVQENGCLSSVAFMQSPDRFRGDAKAKDAICFDNADHALFTGIELDSGVNEVKLKPWRVGGFLPVGAFKGSVPQFGMSLIFKELHHADAPKEGRMVVEGSATFREYSQYTVTFEQDIKRQNRFHIKESVKLENNFTAHGKHSNGVGDLISRDPRSTFYYREPLLLVDIPREVFEEGRENWGQSVPMNGLRILLMREDDAVADAVVKPNTLKKTRRKPSPRKAVRAEKRRAEVLAADEGAPRGKKLKN